MLRGFATINYWADDMDAAKRWYAEFLGMEPYFNMPGYAEFRIGDYQHEFGLIDKTYVPYDPSVGPAGSITYWHVDDVQATYDRLLSLGAQVLDGPRERGHGFVTASVIDPFGNILGVMFNPHYVEVLEKTGPA